jgi:hypothetical protein
VAMENNSGRYQSLFFIIHEPFKNPGERVRVKDFKTTTQLLPPSTAVLMYVLNHISKADLKKQTSECQSIPKYFK